MKRATYIMILLLAVVTSACGVSNRTNPASGSRGGPSAGTLPAATQLVLGTLKLEGSPQAVTAKQAADLLPLWETMKVLSASDTAAQQEKDALITQIQETMTTEQMQAIKDMNLTGRDMANLMQQQGIGASGGSQTSGSQNGNSSGNRNRNFGPGGFPGGGPPPDGGGPGGGFGGQGQNLSKQQIATAQAARQALENTIPPALINAVIQYLQKKAGK